MLKKVIILLVALILAQSKLGIDVSQPHSEDVLKCFVKEGYTFLVTRAYKSYGAFDSGAVTTLANAKNAGMTDAGVYLFPCIGTTKSPQTQVNEMIQGLHASTYNRIWIDVETNQSPNCGWTKDTTFNCNFLRQMVSAVKSAGKEVGIYASHYMWGNIFGSVTNCPDFTGVPLWYPHYDHVQSFADFQAFGSWKTPNIKQYAGTTNMCGGSVDLNFKN